MARFVTEDADVEKLLSVLTAQNAFVTCLPEGMTYHFHHMMKELLLTAIREQPELSPQERGNLLGECDIIMSFLCYNDISAMSRLHRSASSQMSRLAISIQKSGGWTFGSPSVLMMYYRAPGELKSAYAQIEGSVLLNQAL